MRQYFDGMITDGQFKPWAAREFTAYLQSLEGRPVHLSVERGGTRSTAQNRYWHGVVVVMIAEHIGEQNRWRVHEFLKAKFLAEEMEVRNQQTGAIERRTIAGSTAVLSTVEFMDLIAAVQQWAVDFLGLLIPDPNQEQWLDDNKQHSQGMQP